MRRRIVLVVSAAGLTAALSACTPLGSVLGGGTSSGIPRSTATHRPAPQPSGTVVTPARPTVGPAGCTITTPGSHQVADCAVLQVNVTGATVAAGTVGSVRISGDRDQVHAESAAAVRIRGQDNAVVAGGDIGGISIQGDRNRVNAQGRIGSGTVAGNDNVVAAPGGVGAVKDDGARNTIGAQP